MTDGLLRRPVIAGPVSAGFRRSAPASVGGEQLLVELAFGPSRSDASEGSVAPSLPSFLHPIATHRLVEIRDVPKSFNL